MSKKNKKIITYILLFFVVAILGFSAWFSARNFQFGGNEKVKEDALYYINEEILPKEDIEGKAKIAKIDRIIVGNYTHYILAHHQNGEIEGRRKKDGTYEFSINFNE